MITNLATTWGLREKRITWVIKNSGEKVYRRVGAGDEEEDMLCFGHLELDV